MNSGTPLTSKLTQDDSQTAPLQTEVSFSLLQLTFAVVVAATRAEEKGKYAENVARRNVTKYSWQRHPSLSAHELRSVK